MFGSLLLFKKFFFKLIISGIILDYCINFENDILNYFDNTEAFPRFLTTLYNNYR